MISNHIDMDTRIADKLLLKISADKLPVQIQIGIPFVSDVEQNQMVHVQLDCADDFTGELNRIICEIINVEFGLT